MPNGIRWIPNEEIQQHAEEFLSQYWDDTLPVDVEYIAEYCLEISVLLPEMDALSNQARQAGFRRHQYIDRLVDWAAQRIARTFEVSPQVIDKRLHKTGLIADIP